MCFKRIFRVILYFYIGLPGYVTVQTGRCMTNLMSPSSTLNIAEDGPQNNPDSVHFHRLEKHNIFSIKIDI
jgi:hypothetical protein